MIIAFLIRIVQGGSGQPSARRLTVIQFTDDPRIMRLPAEGAPNQPPGARSARPSGRLDATPPPVEGIAGHARIVRGYVLLPHAVPVLTVLAATAGFALLAVGGIPAGWSLGRLLLAMLGGQVLIGTVNELIDAELDAASKPWKPIPAGLVSRRGARLMAIGGGTLMVALGAGFGIAALGLLLLGTGLGVAYDLWFKRSAWSWLPYVLALPLLPVWVWTALDRFEPRLLLLYPLGAPAVVAVHLAQAVPDTVGDRAAGVRNLASLLGERWAIVACWTATSATAALAVAMATLAPGLVDRSSIVVGSAILAVGLVLMDAALYATRRRLGVMACFPCVASGTVAMGLGWVLAVG